MNDRQFLIQTLDLLSSRSSSLRTQQVYLLWKENQSHLNENLLFLFPDIVDEFISREGEQKDVLSALLMFGNLIQQFPLGQRWLNLELCILAYQKILSTRSAQDMSVECASTLNNLAAAYSRRIKGNRSENIEQAITAYQSVLTVMTPDVMPVQWAQATMNLANVYRSRIAGDPSENIEQAISTYQDALTVITLLEMPNEWATTMSNLAIAYFSRIKGDRAENIEQSIALYSDALTVRIKDKFPVQWARTSMNIAIAYSSRIRGNRSENVERALTAYQGVLTVMSKERMPVEWAQATMNLALISFERVKGDRAENIEQTIRAYREVLSVMTQDAMPIEWAQTMHNLAIAYSERIRGEQSENIEQSILACRQALTVRTKAATPVKWGQTMNGLANAYLSRIRGNRADNIEEAISAYHKTLLVMTRDSIPDAWATASMNLANALCNRIRGDRAESIEEAIAIYQNVLTVRTKVDRPTEWAQAKTNLANAYRNRIRGDLSDNVEQAIVACRDALTIRTQAEMPIECAQTTISMAHAYRNRTQGDRAENIEIAIAAYENALSVMTKTSMPNDWALVSNGLANAYSERQKGNRTDNFEKSLSLHKEILETRSRSAAPVDWAGSMNNVADVYSKRIRGERSDNMQKAINAYRKSLEIFSPNEFPHNCRKTSYNLGNLLSQQRKWKEAISTYRQAFLAANILYQNANLLDGRFAELSITADLPRRMAYALSQQGQLTEAIEVLEQGRTRALHEALNRDPLNISQIHKVPDELIENYREIIVQLHNLEAQQRSRMMSVERHELTPEGLRDEAQRLRRELSKSIAQIREISGCQDFLKQPSFDDIIQVLHVDNPLVYFIPNEAGSLALILNKKNIQSVWLDDLTEKDLGEMLDSWFQAYAQASTNRKAWLSIIDQVTGKLWDLVMQPVVAKLYESNISLATLIPTGYFSLLPLHAAWTGDAFKSTGRRYALDDICFTYVPSAFSMRASDWSDVIDAQPDSILAIDQPSYTYSDEEGFLMDISSLPNSTLEVQSATSAFEDYQVLRHEQATKEIVLSMLSRYDVIHFSCHGYVDFRNPLKSGLVMAGEGESAILTLGDIFSINLVNEENSRVSLAVLSACETGLPGLDLVDEVISLPAGLLQSGIAGVVASLWAVSDRSTMLLITRFYMLWRLEGVQPAQALWQAQKWLRDTTNGEKTAYFKDILSKKTVSIASKDVANMLYKSMVLLQPEDRDYAHPLSWAAFHYVGRG